MLTINGHGRNIGATLAVILFGGSGRIQNPKTIIATIADKPPTTKPGNTTMNINQTLAALSRLQKRGAGHTTAAIKVTKEVNGTLILATRQQMHYVEQLARNSQAWPIKMLTLEELINTHGAGFGEPVILDHHAFDQVVLDMRRELDYLSEKLATAARMIEPELKQIKRMEIENSSKPKRRKLRRKKK